MVKTSMEHHFDQPTLFATLGTVFLYLISRFTLSDFAAGATVFAGLATGVLAFYRLYKEIKKDKKEK